MAKSEVWKLRLCGVTFKQFRAYTQHSSISVPLLVALTRVRFICSSIKGESKQKIWIYMWNPVILIVCCKYHRSLQIDDVVRNRFKSADSRVPIPEPRCMLASLEKSTPQFQIKELICKHHVMRRIYPFACVKKLIYKCRLFGRRMWKVEPTVDVSSSLNSCLNVSYIIIISLSLSYTHSHFCLCKDNYRHNIFHQLLKPPNPLNPQRHIWGCEDRAKCPHLAHEMHIMARCSM